MSPANKSKPAISYERSEFIRCLAEDIALEHFHPAKGTDLDSIIIDAGLELVADEFPESFDGLLIKDKQGFRIVCNLSNSNIPTSARGRFTIAHELGHYFLDEHRSILEKCLMPSFGEKAITDNVMEREADLFASRLLLPTRFVRNAFKKGQPGLAGIREIAGKFSVSLKCAAIRYVGEEINSSCVVFRGWDAEIKWKWISRNTWLAGMRKVKSEVVRGGATYQVLSKGSEQKSEIIDSAGSANYFFMMNDIYRQNFDEVFKEESIALGEYGLLTLFTSRNPSLPTMAETLDRRYSR